MLGKRQRGSLLIAAIVLIVVLSLLAATLTSLFVGNIGAGGEHLTSAQALYGAESGLERAVFGYKAGTTCGGLIYSGSVGAGSFTTTPSYNNPASTTLSAAINATDTTLLVGSTAGYAASGRLRIESEEINYAAITGNSFTGVQRGLNGTLAAGHAVGVAVSQDQCGIRSLGTAASAQRTVTQVAVTPQAMMVYAKANGDGIPYFRLWDGRAWGPERQASNVNASIQWLVLKFARTRNEAILGTVNSARELRVQVWDGTSWGPTTLVSTLVGADDNVRSFDIEYESLSDRAVMVFNHNNVNRDPRYRIWDGSVWSAEQVIPAPTGDRPRWIEVAPHPHNNTDDLALIFVDNQRHVYGMIWTGTGWSNMGVTTTWDTGANNPDSRIVDVAYERQSGHAVFIWADNNNDRQYYRVWDGTALTPRTLLTIANMAGTGTWLKLAPDPTSNRLMFGVQDDGGDLNTALWTGAGWIIGPRHDISTEAGNDRNFDIVFESDLGNAGRAWLIWGSQLPGGGNDATFRREWDGAAWGAPTQFGADAALVQLIALPWTGTLLAAIYQDSGSTSRDITEVHAIGGGSAWSGESVIWNGPTVNNPVYERVVIAAQRYVPVTAWFEIYP